MEGSTYLSLKTSSIALKEPLNMTTQSVILYIPLGSGTFFKLEMPCFFALQLDPAVQRGRGHAQRSWYRNGLR